MRYFLRRELFDETDEEVPERIRVGFVETDHPDEIVRPFCLGRGSCCDIAEYADLGRRYEIRGQWQAPGDHTASDGAGHV